MRLFPSLFAAVAALVTAFAAAPAPRADAAPPSPCLTGWSLGDWTLPSGSGSGYAIGKFVESSSNQGLWLFEAKLIPTPTPCLSCVTGEIDGVLHDGNGNIEYYVRGEYSGLWHSGQGDLWGYIYSPWHKTPVGKFQGVFANPPWGTDPGQYKLEWTICP